MITKINFGGLVTAQKPQPLVAPLPEEYKKPQHIKIIRNVVPKPV